jgi:hypothetical protein
MFRLPCTVPVTAADPETGRLTFSYEGEEYQLETGNPEHARQIREELSRGEIPVLELKSKAEKPA